MAFPSLSLTHPQSASWPLHAPSELHRMAQWSVLLGTNQQGSSSEDGDKPQPSTGREPKSWPPPYHLVHLCQGPKGSSY